MGSNRSVRVQNLFDDQASALGMRNNFQRMDFRSAWSHTGNGDHTAGVPITSMVTDATGNGFVYAMADLGGGSGVWRYAYRDMDKHSDMMCSVALNTAIDSTAEGNNTAPYQGAGLVMEDVETGGIISVVLEGRPYGAGHRSNYAILAVQKWTDRTTYDSILFEARIKATGPVFLHVSRENSLTAVRYSLDGVGWIDVYSIDHITAGTPYINTNRLGFGYYNTSSVTDRGNENAASFDWVDFSPAT